MKILHVTESLAAGVGHYLVLVANAQASLGHDVIIAHSIRSDTPVEQLDQMFNPDIRRVVIPMVTQPSPIADVKAVFKLRRLLRSANPDVVHLHSSKAGVLGRLAVKIGQLPAKVFYSPHGFAFLRQDVSPLKQRLFLFFEQIGAKLGGTLISCSASEGNLAKSQVGARSVTLIENAADLKEIPQRVDCADGLVRVMNSGRISFQKNPLGFKQVATSCKGLPVSFTWVGNGDLAPLLGDEETIEITGWLPREALMRLLSQTDIFLMPSLWEGMPLALIEAQAAGIPAVVSDVVGCRDVVVDDETGFVCKTTDELIEKTQLLINNSEVRLRLGRNAARLARTRFDVNRLNRELLDIYEKSK